MISICCDVMHGLTEGERTGGSVAQPFKALKRGEESEVEACKHIKGILKAVEI